LLRVIQLMSTWIDTRKVRFQIQYRDLQANRLIVIDSSAYGLW